MIKKLFKNKTIIILILIIIILVFIKIFPQKNNPLTPNNPSILPSLSITPSQNSNSDEIIDLNYQIPLARHLPYQGKYFQAKRYIDANNLEIIISRRQDTDLAKKEVQDWFTKMGVDQDDTYTIIYQ